MGGTGKASAHLQAEPERRVIAFPSPEPQVTFASYDYIEPGTYQGFSRSAKIYQDKFFKRWTCVVLFDVLDGSLVNVIARLAWYLNLGTGDKPRAGRRGNFWAAWCAAKGSAPKRGDRMTAAVFVHRHVTVEVESVTKNHEGISLSEPSYSKIARIVSWNTGGRE